MKFEAFGKSDIGLVRTNNEDSFCFVKNVPIFILADGMGGHNAGEVASSKAVELVLNHFNHGLSNVESYQKNKRISKKLSLVENMLGNALTEANNQVYLNSLANYDVSGMGTTLDVLYFQDNKYYIGHIGDSRVYLLRAGKLMQVTQDHSVVNQLIKQNLLTKEEARFHPYSHILTNALGIQADVEYDIISDNTHVGDLYLLCSDGLSDMVGEELIETIMKSEKKNLEEKANLLIESAKYSSGVDNITLILTKVTELSEDSA